MDHIHPGADTLALPPILNLTAAAALLENLLTLRGRPLSLNAGDVQRLGAQCLQVLLAARAAWAADEQELSLADCSEDFLTTLNLFGVAPKSLTYCKELP
ncbi:STAS domain-containing protein [Acidocella sp.]|uniref:STAS domain-containing protein n=1 Tax=Acidocella sp. TaxID=50710 RepID=UPI00262DE27B|nr:STAS domain-containing protein [Acidocella sp.]MDD2796145.1 STAS domain-containing protein [Acidocella sp.]